MEKKPRLKQTEQVQFTQFAKNCLQLKWFYWAGNVYLTYGKWISNTGTSIKKPNYKLSMKRPRELRSRKS